MSVTGCLRPEDAVSPSDAPRPDQVFLSAGAIHVATAPAQIMTILGSCVAIAMWDPLAGAGGMNHYMLPADLGAGAASPRFAAYASSELLARLLAAGAERWRLQARLFGGACILASAPVRGDDLGTRNVDAARRFLNGEGIPIVSEHVGGVNGRKVVFRTDSGLALVKIVSSNSSEVRP